MNNFFLSGIFDSIWTEIERTLITDNRYLWYIRGLGNTLLIASGAIVLGFVLGMLIAMVRYYNKKCGRFNILKKVLDGFIFIIRGTPVTLQLLIMCFVVLLFVEEKVLIAIITFGINSSAYVAELLRGGLEGVEAGQFEAGQSLGLSQNQTIFKIIIPQGLKTSLPALCNEFIALVKETSIVIYIGIADITFAATKIQSVTFSAFMPLIISAIIYLALVAILTYALRILERRLTQNERTVNPSKKPV